MWPWAHAAVGYLLYAAYCRCTGRGRPAGPAVLAVGLGTQLPDLIDKPLAWYVGVLPYGRSFAHSLLTGVPFVLAPLVALLVIRGRRDLAVALAVGYLSHLVGDGYTAALVGDWPGIGYLAWPLVPAPVDEVSGLLEQLANVEGEPAFLFGLLVTAVGLAVWVRQRTPGLGTLRAWAVAAVRLQ